MKSTKIFYPSYINIIHACIVHNMGRQFEYAGVYAVYTLLFESGFSISVHYSDLGDIFMLLRMPTIIIISVVVVC